MPPKVLRAGGGGGPFFRVRRANDRHDATLFPHIDVCFFVFSMVSAPSSSSSSSLLLPHQTATCQLPPTNCYQPIATNRGRRSTWCTPGGRMYALTRLGLRRCAAVICVASHNACHANHSGTAAEPQRRQGRSDPLECTKCCACHANHSTCLGAALGALQRVGCRPWRGWVSGAVPLWQVL